MPKPFERALELAEIGRGTTHPNPVVGAVVVAGDEVVGEGWHERAGGPHAEVVGHLQHEQGDLQRGVERVVGRIDVDGQHVRLVDLISPDRRRMELERSLIPEPGQRRGVVADGVRDIASHRRDRHGLDP